ncbi:hypothetical protein B0H21DRAFT_781481 [Amylocystis lapponica]|nr:hypothetical protein B0H21DRAFT_781481 [Amylocystis lapponica]
MPSSALVFGRWTQPNVSERDLEAQVVVGSYEQLPSTALPLPPSARAHVPRAHSSDGGDGTDPLDDFFGIVHSSRPFPGTLDSRHDAAVTPVHDDDLPPYSCASEPPAYDDVAEHPTLAMYLFKLGFLFPLFWLAGALIVLSPLHAPEGWEPFKTEAERQELIERMRQTELKWGKRCLLALSILASAVLVVLTAFFVRP